MQCGTYEGFGRLLDWMGWTFFIVYFGDIPRFEAAVLAGLAEIMVPSLLAQLGRKMDRLSARIEGRKEP